MYGGLFRGLTHSTPPQFNNPRVDMSSHGVTTRTRLAYTSDQDMIGHVEE